MRLNEITWDKGEGLENLALWGIKPADALAQAIIRQTEEVPADGPNDQLDIVHWLAFEVHQKLEDAYACLYRMLDEMGSVKPGLSGEVGSKLSRLEG